MKIESKKDPDLTINYCYVPTQKKSKRLLILSSGVHGIEGYVGSAVQQMFMEDLLVNMNLSEMGVLLIHGMNPYGFKYNRRVTENNVDLNRNCSNDIKLYKSINAGYSDLYTMLNPKEEVSLKSIKNMFFQVNAIQKIIQYSMGTLRQATMGSIRSLHNMIVENQGFHHNYKTKKDETKINKGVLEMYYPSSENWKSKAIENAIIILSKSMKQFQSIER